MIKVMTKASHKKSKTGDMTKIFPPARVKKTAEHHLSNRECVPPVMVRYFLSVVLLHCEDPSTPCQIPPHLLLSGKT